MNEHLQRDLADRFGERASFAGTEREQSARDILHTRGAASSRFMAVPEAIVRVKDADEVTFLANYSSQNRIPLVPRGAATSGYGGTLPLHGGIVVDFTQMKQVLAIYPEQKVVTTEPGLTWQELDERLHADGLTLQVYPGSGAYSTVGGWVASGGVGIGSYKYGPIGENLEWVEVVLFEGQPIRLSRENLALVTGTQGITGLITAVTMPVRARQPETVLIVTFRRLSSFLQTLLDLRRQRIPVWHISFISAAVDAEEDGAAIPLQEGSFMDLPLTRHTALFVVPDALPSIPLLNLRSLILGNSGVIKPDSFGASLWEERWDQSGLGVLGPFTATGAVMLPTVRLESVFREARAQRLPVRLVANLSAKGWSGVRCWSSDGKALSQAAIKQWLRLAGSRGARPYGIDVLETDRAAQYLGPDLHQWLSTFKQRHDPQLLMNPGKLLALGGHPAWLRAASTFDRVIEKVRSRGPSKQHATNSIF